MIYVFVDCDYVSVLHVISMVPTTLSQETSTVDNVWHWTQLFVSGALCLWKIVFKQTFLGSMFLTLCIPALFHKYVYL